MTSCAPSLGVNDGAGGATTRSTPPRSLTRSTCDSVVPQPSVRVTARIFFAIAARATRQILSNYARRQHADKRRAGEATVALEEFDMLAPAWSSIEWSAIDRLWDLEVALRQLEAIYPRACRVVECRYFGGLSIPATADALNISEPTVKRDWALAQAWLFRALKEHGPDER